MRVARGRDLNHSKGDNYNRMHIYPRETNRKRARGMYGVCTGYVRGMYGVCVFLECREHVSFSLSKA